MRLHGAVVADPVRLYGARLGGNDHHTELADVLVAVVARENATFDEHVHVTPKCKVFDSEWDLSEGYVEIVVVLN